VNLKCDQIHFFF